ncbi:hypothetical protein STCU_02850 [Strigomonas culicis]|uniref:Uncharacterized protein n=1 Tax=Strigomonas culicis TaxID=28005 RepID=S9W916_9TRYP|nr:hypothetical protein STCU_02850 [Strigomonas culicis]|eukprot:EPY32360.1 hypothetical protein STCU_02850 [Strigomonas culicis]
MLYIPFTVGASLFSSLNALGSIHCWYVSRRRIMLATGAVNSAIGGAAITMYPYDPKLSNLYCAVAALCAAGQFLLHAMRTPRLLRPSLWNGVYFGWIGSLLVYSAYRVRWVYALRYD